MSRHILAGLLAVGALTACASLNTPHAAAEPRYCSVETFEPCLVQQRTGNCQPCPD
jgi:hypothetical protein